MSSNRSPGFFRSIGSLISRVTRTLLCGTIPRKESDFDEVIWIDNTDKVDRLDLLADEQSAELIVRDSSPAKSSGFEQKVPESPGKPRSPKERVEKRRQHNKKLLEERELLEQKRKKHVKEYRRVKTELPNKYVLVGRIEEFYGDCATPSGIFYTFSSISDLETPLMEMSSQDLGGAFVDWFDEVDDRLDSLVDEQSAELIVPNSIPAKSSGLEQTVPEVDYRKHGPKEWREKRRQHNKKLLEEREILEQDRKQRTTEGYRRVKTQLSNMILLVDRIDEFSGDCATPSGILYSFTRVSILDRHAKPILEMSSQDLEGALVAWLEEKCDL